MSKYVLVACEESQRVCCAFRELGFIAFSCDLQDCSGGHPEWHIRSDVLPLLNGFCSFVTSDNVKHFLDCKWDLIVAHPPCTRLCSSGQRWLYFGSDEYRQKKIDEQCDAIDFFMHFVDADCEHIAIENPVGIMSSLYRKPDCIYNPYDFLGESECKKTCLWLKGLPALVPTQSLSKEKRTNGIFKAEFNGKKYSWSDKEVARLRSQTPFGVAKAMANQWSVALLDNGDITSSNE